MTFEQEFKMTLEDIDKNAYITNKAILDPTYNIGGIAGINAGSILG